MKPIDYLRAMAKRNRKPAIGGLVNAQWRPTETEGCTLTIDNSESRFTRPAGFIRFDGELTEAEADEVRAAFERVVPQMEQMADTMLSTVRQQLPMRCPCVAIYSSCRCGRS